MGFHDPYVPRGVHKAIGFWDHGSGVFDEGDPDANGQRNRLGGWRFHGLPWHRPTQVIRSSRTSSEAAQARVGPIAGMDRAFYEARGESIDSAATKPGGL